MPETLDQLLTAGDELGPVVLHGTVANSPATPDDDLYVTIIGFDGGRQQWGPCPWSPSTALPERGDDCLVLFDERQTPWVVTLAPVTGTGGGPVTGDLNYVHNQGSPAPNWTVVHNLGKYPAVVVVDSGNNVLLPDVHYADLNTVALAFGSATAGKAYVN